MADRSADRIRALFASLEPRLEELDGRRRAIRNTIVAGVVVSALGVGSCLTACDPPGFLTTLPGWRFGPLVLSLASLVCFGFAIGRLLIPGVAAHKEYRARFKKEVVAALVRALQPAARYLPGRSLGRQDYDRSRLFRTHLDAFGGDDLLQGAVGETPFECSELRASYTTGSGDDKKTHDVFKGLFLRIDFDRDVAGHTVVEPAGSDQTGSRGGMDRVAVDSSFDETFEVWSTDPSGARALLGELRDRLLELEGDVGGSLHLAFTGRIAYAAVDYGRDLFEPRIAAALTEKDLAALAAPYVAAVDVVKALGLEHRRTPADPSFHAASSTPSSAKGLEALAARLGSGDVGLQDMLEAVAEDEESTAPVVPPANPWPRLSPTGVGLEVVYPMTFGALLALGGALALTPVLGVSLLAFASANGAARLGAEAARLWPAGSEVVALLLEYPTVFLLGTLFLWWLFAASLAYRTTRVLVEPGGIWIRRLAWTGLELPLDVVRRVQATNRSVAFVRADRGLLRGFVMAAPNCRSAEEARWVAAELRTALKRCGWRPAAKP